MTIKRLVVNILLLFLTSIIAITLSAGSSPTLVLKANAANLTSCQEILTQAIALLQNSCQVLGRNKACYGNDKVKAEPSSNSILNFDKAGDIAFIQAIRTIETSPLNLTAGTWGLSLLKLQANLPDSLPGQNITFLVYGNTHIDNTSGDMRSFYFSSGLGAPDCKGTPQDGIVIKSPNHTQVTFTANGVEITIASTIELQAEPNKSMSVSLIEGHASVSTYAGTQILQPGQTISIPLGGSNGLNAAGAPSSPIPMRSDSARNSLVNVASQLADSTLTVRVVSSGSQITGAPLPVSTVNTLPDSTAPNSAVTLISGIVTAVHGNFITVNGYTINVGNNHDLKNAKVGDYVEISGTLKIRGNKELDITSAATGASSQTNNNIGQNNNASQISSAGTTNNNNDDSNNGKDKDKGKDKKKDKDK